MVQPDDTTVIPEPDGTTVIPEPVQIHRASLIPEAEHSPTLLKILNEKPSQSSIGEFAIECFYVACTHLLQITLSNI